MENAHPMKNTDFGTNSNISAFRLAKSSSGFPDQSKKNQTQQTQISPEAAKRLICSTSELSSPTSPTPLESTNRFTPMMCCQHRSRPRFTQRYRIQSIGPRIATIPAFFHHSSRKSRPIEGHSPQTRFFA